MYAREHASPDPGTKLPGDEQVEAAVEAFRLLADTTRLRLLWALSSEDHDVGTLAGLVGATRPATSQHLAKLRLGGLVSMRREGRRAIYSAKGSHVRALIAEAVFQADHQVRGEAPHE